MTNASPDFDSPRAWAIDAAYCIVAGVALGVLGPFGSFVGAPLVGRLLQWTLSSLAVGLVYGVALRAVRPLARRHHIPVWAWVPAVVLVVAAPFSAASRVVDVAAMPALAKIGWLEWYGQAILTTLPLTGIYLFLRVRLAASPVHHPAQPPPSIEVPAAPANAVQAAEGGTPFLRRLPPRLGREILCLVMEDHYVRAHTSLGSELILLPLHKAVAELEGLEGMQVHRSWWVARSAVTGSVVDGRNLRLRLTNGLESPVARSAVARLRAAGWL